MTNPFNSTPANVSAPTAAPSLGGNPFAQLGNVQGDLPLLPPEVTAQVVISGFRIVPAQIGSQVGDAVYVDFTLEKVYGAPADAIKVKEGESASHRINGFAGTGARFSAIELKSLFLCALHADGLTAESLSPAEWATFPMQVRDQGLLNGKRICIKTSAKGKAFKKTVAEYMPVA